MLIDNRYIGSPVLYDSNGHILKGYYQWDINQKITIKGLPAGCTLECHFAKSACSASYAVQPEISGDIYTVFVPNEILKSPDNFFLYLYVDTPEDGQRTKYEYEIEVRYRAKPETYIEPTPEERITMRGMMLKAEGYAVGTHDGQPVGEDDPAYENNAKYYAERAIIDTEVLIEEHNHDPEAHEELFDQKEDKKPYLSLEREARYLYKVSFAELPDADEDFVPAGLCSSYVKDGKLYRNLDWNYTNDATFHVVLPGIEGTSFIHGLTDTELDDDLIAQLPYRMVDGKNENDIMMSTHVLYNDWEWHGEGNVPLTMLPYIALNMIKSMATIEEDIADILSDLRTTPALDAMEYLIQVLVTDGTTSYVLRPKTDGSNVYEAVDISENVKLSNFLWVENETVDRVDLQTRPTGVERFNMMPCSLNELRFTVAYEEPTRLSEFIGLRGTTKDSTDEELLDIYETAHDMYLDRERDGSTWQTMHSVVYSAKGMEHLYIQEDWSRDMATSGSIDHRDLEHRDADDQHPIGAITGLEDALDEKVDKITGKGLSTNDYTNADKSKLDGVEAGAEANVQPDWNQTDTGADDYIKNKPTIPEADTDAVHYTEDSGRTAAEKAQARANINAAAPDGYYGESGGVFEYSTNFLGKGAPTNENNIVFRPTASQMSGQSWGTSHSVSGEIATIEKIKGKTLVFNQLIHNGKFSSTSYWNVQGVSISVANNILTATLQRITADYNVAAIIQPNYGLAIETPADHMILRYAEVNPSVKMDIRFTKIYSSEGASIIAEPNTWSILAGISKASSSGWNTIRITGSTTAIPLTVGDTLQVKNVMLIDLTKMFGAGNEPATVEEFKAMFPLDYYEYNTGELVSFNGTGLKTVGFNAYHNGTAELLGGTQYQITGTYTALSFGGETVTPDSNGIFTVPKNGTLSVTGGDGTTCVHLVWTGLRNGEYEPYWERTLALPVSTYFPDRMKSVGTVYDELTKDKAIQRIGSRAYESGDEDDSTVITDGTTTFYPLEIPVETPISPALEFNYKVDDFGTEMLLPRNDGEPVTAPMDAEIVYHIDYEGQVRNNDSINITKKSMDSFIAAYNNSGAGTISQTWDDVNKKYSYNVTSDVLPKPSAGLAVGKYFRVATYNSETGAITLEAVDEPSGGLPALTGTTAPTQSTVGEVGQLYINPTTSNNQKIWICISATNGVYTWIPFFTNHEGNGENGNAVNLTTGNAFNGRYNVLAIGSNAVANIVNAIAIGSDAIASGNGAFQLGPGTNNNSNTFQVGAYRMLDRNTGLIPFARMNDSRSTMDSVAVAGAQYYLGTQSAVSITMPTDAEVGQEIKVYFKSGSTAATLACNLDGFDYTPKANTAVLLTFRLVHKADAQVTGDEDEWTVQVEEG